MACSSSIEINTRKSLGKCSPSSCEVQLLFHFLQTSLPYMLLFSPLLGNIQSSASACSLSREEGALKLYRLMNRCCTRWLLCQPLTSVPVLPTVHGSLRYCCLNTDSFIRILLHLESIVSADLIGKVREFAVQFISGCL